MSAATSWGGREVGRGQKKCPRHLAQWCHGHLGHCCPHSPGPLNNKEVLDVLTPRSAHLLPDVVLSIYTRRINMESFTPVLVLQSLLWWKTKSADCVAPLQARLVGHAWVSKKHLLRWHRYACRPWRAVLPVLFREAPCNGRLLVLLPIEWWSRSWFLHIGFCRDPSHPFLSNPLHTLWCYIHLRWSFWHQAYLVREIWKMQNWYNLGKHTDVIDIFPWTRWILSEH